MMDKISRTLFDASVQAVLVFTLFLIIFLCSNVDMVLLVSKFKQMYFYRETDLFKLALHGNHNTTPLIHVFSFQFPEIVISMAALNHPHANIIQYFKLWPP